MYNIVGVRRLAAKEGAYDLYTIKSLDYPLSTV